VADLEKQHDGDHASLDNDRLPENRQVHRRG
jgi:hypothetical protein